MTFGIARDVPIGIVIANYHSRLSRVYLWNLMTDEFTPGQFIKGRATVESISPDAKYFAYRTDAFHRRAQSYACIAKPPYFTALAFFPHYPLERASIYFLNNGDIYVRSRRVDLPWVDNFDLVQERIEPGFPGKILREGFVSKNDLWSCQDDPHRLRRIWTENNELHAENLLTEESKLIREFPKETFEAIEAPDWAKVW